MGSSDDGVGSGSSTSLCVRARLARGCGLLSSASSSSSFFFFFFFSPSSFAAAGVSGTSSSSSSSNNTLRLRDLAAEGTALSFAGMQGTEGEPSASPSTAAASSSTGLGGVFGALLPPPPPKKELERRESGCERCQENLAGSRTGCQSVFWTCT